MRTGSGRRVVSRVVLMQRAGTQGSCLTVESWLFPLRIPSSSVPRQGTADAEITSQPPYTRPHSCVHTHTRARAYTRTHAHVRTRMHACTHAHTRTHARTHIHVVCNPLTINQKERSTIPACPDLSTSLFLRALVFCFVFWWCFLTRAILKGLTSKICV